MKITVSIAALFFVTNTTAAEEASRSSSKDVQKICIERLESNGVINLLPAKVTLGNHDSRGVTLGEKTFYLMGGEKQCIFLNPGWAKIRIESKEPYNPQASDPTQCEVETGTSLKEDENQTFVASPAIEGTSYKCGWLLYEKVEDPRSDAARRVLIAFNGLLSDPTVDNWNKYLEIFPKTKSDFKRVFDADDFPELYSASNAYISILNSAPTSSIKAIIESVISITKEGAPGCCDAWTWLHAVAITYAQRDIRAFASPLKRLEGSKRRNVIKFMTDQESPGGEIQAIISDLRSIKERTIATEFEQAQKSRRREKH